MNPSELPVNLDKPESLKLEKLNSTSPSSFNQMKTCNLRIAFANDTQYKNAKKVALIPILGTVSHAMIEEVFLGKFDGCENVDILLRNRWDELISEEVTKFPSTLLKAPPKPTRWPYYNKRRLEAFSKCLSLIDQKGSEVTKEEGQLGEVEPWYSSHDGLLRGRIDRVLSGFDGDITLIDYKTGQIKGDANCSNDLNPNYLHQMQIYAFMYHETNGVWPSNLIIESVEGESVTIQVVEKDCEETANDAVELLLQYNESVQGGSIEASPGIDACRWCDYKGVCDDFFATATPEWDMFRFHLKGILAKVISTPREVVLEIDNRKGNVPYGKVRVQGLPLAVMEAFSVGDEISMTDLKSIKRADDNSFMFEWDSQVWIW